ncbi:MAG: four helix bundle protein [Saprospiraceae bacterium]|nr:four helix bundle protein [Saprospiraceae bacterium]
MEKQTYISLKNLVVYQISRELSRADWEIYANMNFEQKKLMGDQFLRATDSVGANIVEGYGRFHYLDQVRFYYIARASLQEAFFHWLELMHERGWIMEETFKSLSERATQLQVKLNNFIQMTKNQKK